MKEQLYFNKVTHNPILDTLKIQWRKTLTGPQDGMWETLTDYANHLEIKADNQTIGYACVDDENRLLQCYIIPEWLHKGIGILEQLMKEAQVSSALVGTNNPVFMSLVMHFQQSVTIDTYLFTDEIASENTVSNGTLKLAWQDDLTTLVTFYNESVGAPKEWLQGYLGNLITRGELFFLFDGTEILGTCEVRNSDTDSSIADVGMVVSSNHRQKGIGSFLLGKAKELAYDLERRPICSCEKDNLGSLKSIHKNGFRSTHQMLKISF